MKIRNIFITIAIILQAPYLSSQEIDSSSIIKYMVFPEEEYSLGNRINNPLFAIFIRNKEINTTELKKTISSLEKILSDKTNPYVYYQLGNYYKDLNDIESSIRFFKKFLSLTSRIDFEGNENIKIIISRGETYYSLSEIDLRTEKNFNLEKSLLHFKKSIELNPDDYNSWLKLGDCYLSLGNPKEAIYCYTKNSEKNKNDILLNTRLQAASFQIEYIKLINSPLSGKIENQSIIDGIDFDYIQTAINNSPADLKESLKLQHYIYLLRLMLIKSESFVKNNRNDSIHLNTIFSENEKGILKEVEKLLLITDRNIGKFDLEYLSCIVSYLQADYIKSASTFRKMLNENFYSELIADEILFISLQIIKDNNIIKKIIEDAIKIKPDPKYYLYVAGLEFRKKNLEKAEMLCNRVLNIDKTNLEAYSGIAVINALKGNYITADEMIKKGNSLNINLKNNILSNEMKVNEAVIALLKNEKERAYLLLRTVISVDNNEKASELYNRYFIKK